MIGQTSIFDVLIPADSGERIWCPSCHSNWGPGLKLGVLGRLQDEHRTVSYDRCAEMLRLGVTEPYYALTETPWLSGWVCQFPRPKGFGGLYELHSPQAVAA